MVELLCFWLSRIGGAWLELRLLRSSDGGFRVAVMLAALVVLACLVALALHA